MARGEPARDVVAEDGGERSARDAGRFGLLEGDEVCGLARVKFFDAAAERREKPLGLSQQSRALRVGAQEEEYFVEADERAGRFEVAPRGCGEQAAQARAGAPVSGGALQLVEFVEQSFECLGRHALKVHERDGVWASPAGWSFAAVL